MDAVLVDSKAHGKVDSTVARRAPQKVVKMVDKKGSTTAVWMAEN
jgi:hypothetical protein